MICKFFVQGNCRYGSNCRFEHVYNTKYNYQANVPAPPPPTHVHITDELLVKQVQNDVQAVLNGNQWILTCYAPYKEKAIFPGLSDLSPEECRLYIYEAKANNTLEQAMVYINNCMQEAKVKYQQLLHPSSYIVKTLRRIYNDEAVESPFTSQTPSGSDNASSLFRSAVQNTSFEQGQNNFNDSSARSVFAQANNNMFGTSLPLNSPFNKQTSDTTAKSLFSQANQNLFNTNQVPQHPANIFSNANQAFKTSNSPFEQQPSSVFTKNSFENSPFHNVSQQNSSDENGVYSKVEDLSENDLEHFKSDNFKLGFVPELPPPKSLCL